MAACYPSNEEVRYPRYHPRASAAPLRASHAPIAHTTGGLYHAFMEDITARLGLGDWVHVFPTGTRDKDSRSLGPIKPGVASHLHLVFISSYISS